MSCPFCKETRSSATVYPRIAFNQKSFEYRNCIRCSLKYLSPLPEDDDYFAMYPPSYQGNTTDTSILEDFTKKMPGLRFSYGRQLDLVKAQLAGGGRMLDYGCGNGHFVGNAVYQAYSCDGAEFSAEYVTLLKQAFPASGFYTINEVLSDDFEPRYDVIRLSNVLEHLTDPGDVIRKLASRLKPDGVLLVEGPVEANFNLAETFRRIYFGAQRLMKPSRFVVAPPYHIFYSNRKNQRVFFRDCGLKELHFEVAEDAWPFPPSVSDAQGIKNKCMAVIAQLSKGISSVSGKRWGNTFIYCGKR